MSETVDCRTCGGTGKLPKPCGLCAGNGYVLKSFDGQHQSGMSVGAAWTEPCPNGCHPLIGLLTTAS